MERRLDIDFVAVGPSRSVMECKRTRRRKGECQTPGRSPAQTRVSKLDLDGSESACQKEIYSTPVRSPLRSPDLQRAPEDAELKESGCLLPATDSSSGSPCSGSDPNVAVESPQTRHLFDGRHRSAVPAPDGRQDGDGGHLEAQRPVAPPPTAVIRRSEASYAVYKVNRRRGRAAAISSAAAAHCLLVCAYGDAVLPVKAAVRTVSRCSSLRRMVSEASASAVSCP